MHTKPRLFLLDAVVVIELYKQRLWSPVTDLAEILVPGSVVRESVVWYPDPDEDEPEYHETGHPIDLQTEGNQGRISIIDMERPDIDETRQLFDPATQEGLHIGELEALAYLHGLKQRGQSLPEFCTADRLAFRGLCLLGMSQQAVSLEELLQRIGLGRELKPKFSQAKLDEWLKAGNRDFVLDFKSGKKRT